MTIPFSTLVAAVAAVAVALPITLPSAFAQSATTAAAETPRPAQPQSEPSSDALAAQVDRLIQGNADETTAKSLISEALDSKSESVRWRAARAAGHLGLSDPDTVAKLQRGAANGSWVVQLHSIAALAQAGDKSDRTIEVLTDAAVSSNPRVAAAAIAALRKLQVDPQKMADTFSKVLATNDGAVAIYVVEALVDAGAQSVPVLKACLKEPNGAYWASLAIADIGPDAAGTVPELAAFLDRHDKAEAIPQALMALAAIGSQAKSAEPAIAAAMERWNNDQSVQLSGMYALGAIGATQAKAILDKRASSDDAFVAMVASWALAKTNPGDDELLQSAIKRLVAGLKQENPNIAQAAAHGLVTLEIPAGKAAPLLLEAAKEPEAREHIVSALASLGEKVIPHAGKALANPDTRELAVDVLLRMGNQAEGAVSALAACLDQVDPSLQVRINDVLANIGPEASSATQQLAAQLGSSNAEVRQSAMYALREIGPKASLAKDALLEHLRSVDANSTAGRFEQLATAWTLARVASDEKEVTQAVIPVIREGLKSDSELERRESILAAMDLGDAGKSLHETIQELAIFDPSAHVRETALTALGPNG